MIDTKRGSLVVAMLSCTLLALAGCATDSNKREPTMMTTTNASERAPKMLTDVKGTGAPLVLVGGGLTGWQSWEPHQARLASTRSVTRAQPLAVQYGLDGKELPPGYSVRFESRALAAAIEAVYGREPIDVVAWSYGGEITLDYALEHPKRIRTLTLIEPPAFWVLDATGTADDQSRRESDEVHALYKQMKVDVTPDQLATFVRQAGLVPPGKSAEELPPWPNWVKHRRSLRTGDAPWAHTDDAARLRAFTKPVLLVKGTGSAHFLHRITDGLASALPNAEVFELPGGHAPQLVAMEPFLAKLEALHGRLDP
jgi:pimeloyl-ACP methyl ester carboxylesterase